MATTARVHTEPSSERDRLLVEVQDRVLWLAMQMVHHANNVRQNPGGLKVGGHQASSSSVVTIMTSLYFDFMRAGDRISVKPHASPVYHAIQYLLGNLDQKYLKTLRAFHGLQAYPSRTKDPDGVDFSTGAVGLGAVAPNFAALVDEYASTHLYSQSGQDRRYLSLLGDAELDEGAVWEAIAEPSMADVKNVLWVVDLNRQSLDRVIPGIRVQAWRQMFAANGWRVIDAKYGKRLQAAYEEPNGELLRQAIDDMPNEVYQRLLRVPQATVREWLPRTSRYPEDLARFISRWGDEELQTLIRNLGGHDFAMLREAFSQAALGEGPSVVFAYTLKGWMLPSVGDPQNHSVTLTSQQMEQLRTGLGVDEDDIWSAFEPDSAAGRLCSETSSKLQHEISLNPATDSIDIPSGFDHAYRGSMSTQQIFGLVLTDASRNLPGVAERIVTVSPDVASSTNLGGWINKVGVWARGERGAMPEEEIVRSLNWQELRQGQHVELGISENNLFMMLGQLGLSYETNGELLFPIGTVYDPFVRRGLDAFFLSVYGGAKFIVVGTPSGVTLAPEGGAHQSMITPSIGVEMPELDFYEPCFGQELEWIMLGALERIRRRERSTYLRLTSKRVDQGLLQVPEDPEARDRLRRQVLGGAYRLVDTSGEPGYQPGVNVVHVFASGAMVPEAVRASKGLLEEGVMANVINITGPGPLYRQFQEMVRGAMRAEAGPSTFMADVIPSQDRGAPVVTVVDGHPHSLAWLGGALETRVLPLGVTGFGQSGTPDDLYREYEIDVESIMAACFGALDL
jgi:pyruvate dehydrogenase E1 component